MKKLNKLAAVLLALGMATTLFACGGNTGTASEASGAEEDSAVVAAPAQSSAKPKVALLIPGTMGDKSFLDSAAAGMEILSGEGYETKIVEMGLDETKWVPTMTDISEQDYDIIVTGPWNVEDALWEVAPEFPEQKYILFDTEFEDGNPDNVCSILYDQNELAFITGALAAKISASDMPLVSGSGTIGFVGGMDIPVINDFMVSYVKGAQYADPDIKVAVSYVGDFVDSATGKELALAQYNNQGVDVVFQCASQSGLGCLEAAKELDRYVIGVDTDQGELFMESDAELAGHVVTSALKKVGESIVAAVKEEEAGGLPWGGSIVFGLNDDAIGLAETVYADIVPEDIRAYITELEGIVASGEIEMVSAFGMTADEVNEIKNSVRP